MKKIVDSVKKSGKYENSEIALNREKDNELKIDKLKNYITKNILYHFKK